ncbi:calmodulin-binding protein 60 A-like [Salvia splendens]|uniref:calmodulin-binding protein 60 A-like n=1 Tax=Salvia splendens TaxID=180675 RepID=UPI001C265842|nr:calmodulin-binding protein 60 A-like [Salvia splendens]
MELDPNAGSSEHPSCSYPSYREEDVAINLHSQAVSEGCTVSLDRMRGMVIKALQPAAGRLLREGTRNEFSEERSLQLKFLDNRVADTVTGQELKGLKGGCLKLVLLDPNGHTVTCGPGSSAKVEILLLEGDGDESNMTLEKFDRSIIQKGDTKKPHISPKSGDILLKKGVADLNDIKLGHDSDWSRLCSCRLGARIAQNLKGTTVQEAWTAPFKVKDKRGNQYGKFLCPYLTSEVWRLKGIDRTGKRRDRLKKKHIETVQDFLFWLHVNPEELQNKILRVGDGQWNTILSNAQSCKIDCEKMFCHISATEPQRFVVYDCVGKIKGEMIESQFVGIDNMCADQKDGALKLLRSALQRASALYDDENEFTYPITSTIGGYGPLGSKERGEVPKPDPQFTPLHTSDYDLQDFEIGFENEHSFPGDEQFSGKWSAAGGEMEGVGGSKEGSKSALTVDQQLVCDNDLYYDFPGSPNPMLYYSSHILSAQVANPPTKWWKKISNVLNGNHSGVVQQGSSMFTAWRVCGGRA